MIIGTLLGEFGAVGRRKAKKARRLSPRQVAYEACIAFKVDELGYSRSDAAVSCSGSFGGAGFAGARGGGLINPYQIITTGRTPRWNPRDPRAQLTNVAALVYQQIHP